MKNNAVASTIYGLLILMFTFSCSSRPGSGQSRAEQDATEEALSENQVAELEEETYPEFLSDTSKDYAIVFKPDVVAL